MAMKILLINPPISGPNPKELQMREPLGLAYLAAVLSNSNYEVLILDFYAMAKGKVIGDGDKFRKGLSDGEILQSMDRINPDIIGISCNFTIFSEDSYNVARLCKIRYNNKLVIIGGAHASILTADDLQKNKYIDIVVKGEGENTLLDIVKKYDKGENLNTIPGTLIKKEKKVIVNPPRDLIADLDSVPLPTRRYLDMKFYLSQSDIFGHVKKTPVAVMVTSRGCPFDCIFCMVKGIFNRRWRSFSASRVIEEIKSLIKDYGVKEIYIYDDNFIIDRKRVIEICNRISEEELDIIITLPSGMPVKLIDYELLKTLKKAGLYRVVFPIESGCEKTLKFVRKDINLNEAKKKIKMASRLGLWATGHFIIGFPYETKEDINQTINYAENSGLDFASFFVAQPFIGSDLYEVFKREGLLPGGKLDNNSRVVETKYNTKYLTAKELRFIRDKTASRYLKRRFLKYFNPREFLLYLYPKINSLDKIRYLWKLLTTNRFLKIVLNKQKF